MIDNIKGAIFDLDGTLIDSLALWDVIWSEMGKRYLNNSLFSPSPEVDKAVRTMTFKEALEFISKTFNIEEKPEILLKSASEAVANFYLCEVKLKKGVVEFLEELHSRGVIMCIASATDKSLIEMVIKRFDIGKYFSHILSCADIGKGKDSPDIYLCALESLGTKKEETYVFEDSHVAILTAHNVGLKTVGIYDRYNYGQEEIKKIADEYVSQNQTLMNLNL